MTQTTKKPKVFISYAWASQEYQDKVMELANALSRDGIKVLFDKWSLKEGNDMFAYMEQCVTDPNITNVIILLDPIYEKKANEHSGGVGTETELISAEVYNTVTQEKFLPVVFQRSDDGTKPIPKYLKRLLHFDLSLPENFDREYKRLVNRLYGIDSYQKPELGTPPAWLDTAPTVIVKANDLDTTERNIKNGKTENTENNANIDDYEPTTFFDERFRNAFPGLRETKVFNDPEECVVRLKELLKEPLRVKKTKDPLWWFRGTRAEKIFKFEKVSKDKFLLNDVDEIKVKKIVAFPADKYYKKFVYVETYGEDPTGLFKHNEDEDTRKNEDGFLQEEYALYNGQMITKAEAYDGVIYKDKKYVTLNGDVKNRIRYITPYNFIICAKYNPININNYVIQNKINNMLNGILTNQNSIDEIIEYVKLLPKHENDL